MLLSYLFLYNLPFLVVCEPHKDPSAAYLLGALCFTVPVGTVEQVFATWMNWRMNVFLTSPFALFCVHLQPCGLTVRLEPGSILLSLCPFKG